ncbi:MAG: hypothetical protein AB7S71_10905 [Dongiaceae bacterium]
MVWRLRRLIAAYGADPERWPAGQRARAEALLARSAKARNLLVQGRTLDAWLRADAPAAADERLAAAIIAGATSIRQERSPGPASGFDLSWPLPRLWPQALGLAAAAVLGLIVGWTDALPPALGGAETIDLADFLDAGDDGALL